MIGSNQELENKSLIPYAPVQICGVGLPCMTSNFSVEKYITHNSEISFLLHSWNSYLEDQRKDHVAQMERQRLERPHCPQCGAEHSIRRGYDSNEDIGESVEYVYCGRGCGYEKVIDWS